ncbi:MAG: hypothetical protein JSV44_03340, partial [Candidatus Zixiibacteriota bacterium]
MRYIKSLIFVLHVLAIGLPVRSASLFLPVGLEEYRFIYDRAERSEIVGLTERLKCTVGPYHYSELPPENPIVKYGRGLHGPRIRPFLFATEDFRIAKHMRADGYECLRGGIMAKPGQRWSIFGNFILDEQLAKDPDYTGKKWRGLAGEVENAWVGYRTDAVDLIFGRFDSFWGPVRRSLILSSSAVSMDALSFRVHWGRLYFTYQAGKLDGERIRGDSGEILHNRFFAGHRLDFRLVRQLYIGFFETVIYGGEGRELELAYLNPINFFHAWQINEDADDNTLLGMDFRWYVDGRHKFYGQFLFDDFQVDNDRPEDQEPNETG